MLTVSVDSKPVMDVLSELIKRSSNLKPAMAAIGTKLESQVSARFETETDPLGHHWEPWAESTRKGYPFPGSAAARRERKDGRGGPGNGRILDLYADMLGGLNHKADADSVRVGFAQPYATFHEFGTNHMPRRGLLMADPETGTLAPDDERAVLDILGTFLTDKL